MVGKRENEGNLENFGWLEGKAAGQHKPGFIIRTQLGSDPKKEGQDHQQIGERRVQFPQAGHLVIVELGKDDRGNAAQAGGADLDEYFAQADVDQPGIGDPTDEHDAESGKGKAQKPEPFIGLPDI